MPTKEKILGTLGAQSGPVTLKHLSTVLGEPQGNFFTQLDRMRKADPPLVNKDEDSAWEITEDGRKWLDQNEEDNDRPPAETLRAAENPMAVMSEYDKFKQLGRQSGVTNKELLTATCQHVWAQEYHNLETVHAALIQAGIAPDIANRWTAFWGSFLKQTITPELEEKMSGSKVEKGGVITEGKSLRDKLTHIVDATTGLALWVGAGYGDYTYDDAQRASSQFLAAKARGAASGTVQQGQGDAFDQALKIVELINAKKEEGAVQPNKNYVVKTDAEGNVSMEEVDHDKPTIVQAAAPLAKPQGMTGVSSQATELVALVNALAELGLVKRPGPDNVIPQQQKSYIYVDAEGKAQEIQPGQPIIIRERAPSTAIVPSLSNSFGSVTIEQPDGTKQVVNNEQQLNLVIKLEDYKDRRRREEDSHQNRIAITNTFKDLLGKASKAAERMASRGPETTPEPPSAPPPTTPVAPAGRPQ
jgi:hypothetical protein